MPFVCCLFVFFFSECDEAIASIKASLGDLGKPIKPTKTYLECQAQMNDVSRALVRTLNELVHSTKTNEVMFESKR